jgi:hypothetical protein
MIRRDYILRQIEQFVAMLAKIAVLAGCGAILVGHFLPDQQQRQN